MRSGLTPVMLSQTCFLQVAYHSVLGVCVVCRLLARCGCNILTVGCGSAAAAYSHEYMALAKKTTALCEAMFLFVEPA